MGNKTLVEVGAVWISESKKEKPILGIKIDRKPYVAFKNAQKAHDDFPDYYIFQHQDRHSTESVAQVGAAWIRYYIPPDATGPRNRESQTILLLKILEEYFIAFPRTPDDPTKRGSFVVVAHRTVVVSTPFAFPEADPIPPSSKDASKISLLMHNLERLKNVSGV